jgi:hypothetical protein
MMEMLERAARIVAADRDILIDETAWNQKRRVAYESKRSDIRRRIHRRAA